MGYEISAKKMKFFILISKFQNKSTKMQIKYNNQGHIRLTSGWKVFLSGLVCHCHPGS